MTSGLAAASLHLSNRMVTQDALVSRRGLHGLKTEARTRPVPEIVWPDPTRPERHS